MATSTDANLRADRQIARRLAIATILIVCLGAFCGLSRPAIAESANRDALFGPFGPEGPRLREQLWMLPSGDPGGQLRATVFRPIDSRETAGSTSTPRHPLIVINHGTSDSTRLAVAMPVYYWLSRWFVERGYVVVLPQRRGHGSTGGPLVESVGSCNDPDHFTSGQIAADDVEAVVDYMSQQPFIEPGETIVAGISTGGWASLALASRSLANVRAVINFAGGRGGHAGGRANAACGEQRLIEAAGAFGSTARLPTLWLYSANDSYFDPHLARAMAAAWNDAGGAADLHILPPYADDGHEIADDRAGWELWGPSVERFLEEKRTPQIVDDQSESPGSDAALASPAALTTIDQPASPEPPQVH